MSNHPATQSFGWNLGILSGLFAALQVLISASAARDNIYSIESIRWAFARLTTGGGNPVAMVDALAPVVLIAYGSMIVTGAISLALSYYAGRLTAYVNGRHTGGAGAGFRVALLSGAFWLVFTVLISLLLHGDGTITGIVASTPDGSALGPQLGGLLIQELLLAAIGLGLGAWAGYIGASRAPLADDAPPVPMAAPMAAYGGYNGYGMYPMYPVYPTAPGYPAYGQGNGQGNGMPNGGYPLPAAPYPPAQPMQQPGQPVGAMPAPYPPPANYYRPAEAAPSTTPQPQLPEQSQSRDVTAEQPPQN